MLAGMHQDGRNSARPRSARLRASHDYGATELESMRRRAGDIGEQAPRTSAAARVAAALRRLARSSTGQERPPAAGTQAGMSASAGLGE